MRIEVNNGNFVEIERNRFGVTVMQCDKNGYVEEKDMFDDGEIIMAINLLRYMRENNLNKAFLFNSEIERYLDNLLRYGDIEEFQIFQ